LHGKYFKQKQNVLPKKARLVLIVFIAVSLLTAGIVYKGSLKPEPVSTIDLQDIRERGKLIAVTDFNSTDYFIYRGEPMGFNYELLKSFTKHLGTGLEIITENNLDNAMEMLRSGKADLMAISIPVDSPGMNDLRFSVPVDEMRQVLVRIAHGRKPVPPKGVRDVSSIRDTLGLGKNAVYVQTGFTDISSLSNLTHMLGDSVNVMDVPYEQETLIRYVSEGIIDYTVCDENIAIVNSTYYRNIDIATPAGQVRKIGWAAGKKSSAELLNEFNTWFTEYRKTRDFAFLYTKYFNNSRSGIIIKSNYYANNTGRISVWDDIIRKYSANIQWDWRLIASLICQESRFNPSVESHRGAFGLMQMMPETAARMGIDSSASPEDNIRAGIKYINWLHTIFDPKIADEQERIFFILAAYNAGPGHVLDAMRLAEKNGLDPQVWEGNVEPWLLKKSLPEYYNDEVVKSGKFRGVESVKFVAEIIDRYSHYRNVVPE
jgi:membrane-bound lytic murein transglycosylase F